MGLRDHLNPCDPPDPATIRTSVRRAIRLENEASAASRRRRPTEVRAKTPPIPTSATIVPEDQVDAETIAAEARKARAARTKGRPIATPKPTLARSPAPRPVEELEEEPSTSVDDEPSIEDTEISPRRPRTGLVALAGGLAGVAIVAVIGGIVAALVFGAQQTGVEGALSGSALRPSPAALAPAAPPVAAVPVEPPAAPKVKRNARKVAAPAPPAAEAPVEAAPAVPAVAEPPAAEIPAPAVDAAPEAEPEAASEAAPAEAPAVEAPPAAPEGARPPPPSATLRPKASEASPE